MKWVCSHYEINLPVFDAYWTISRHNLGLQRIFPISEFSSNCTFKNILEIPKSTRFERSMKEWRNNLTYTIDLKLLS